MNEAILVELKKMNELLERIDWKLWNLHKKYVDGMVNIDDVRRQLATEAASVPTVAPAPVVAPAAVSVVEERQEYEYDLDIKPVNKVLTPVAEVEVSTGEVKLPVIPKYPTVEKI